MIDEDAALLASIAQGDQAAIRQMVSQKLPRILALATRMLGNRADAEEVAQETFVRLWQHAPNWRTGEAKFDTWLHRVAMNLCYDKLRAKPNFVLDISDDEAMLEAQNQVDVQMNPERQVNQTQQSDLVVSAFVKLPPRQREALILQYYQSLSNNEAASIMQISVDALESLLSRARRNLKTLLLQQGFEKEIG